MKVRFTIFVFISLLFALVQSTIRAGTTGKLTGQVTDSENGEPLPYVNITIEGTTMGAATDIEGYYVILNIPPGDYTIKVQYVGYQTIVMEHVPITADLTTTRNFELTASALELGELVVTAERKLIKEDNTGSLSTFNSDQIESLPVQQVQEVLRLSAGVIESDGRLHIRGGRPGEVAYWVDGISATDVYDGRIGTTIENSAIQELQVISGTFNAEYGQAMSGIINIITKQGGEDYHGQVKVYGGDYVSNAEQYSLYKSLVTDRDPNTGLTRIVSSEKDYPLKDFNPVYNVEANLSGPIPFTGGALTFFVNGRYFSDEGYYYGRNWYKPNGAPGDNSLVALNPLERTSAQGKLTYQLSNSIRLSYNLFWNKSKRDRNYFRINSIDYQFNTESQANYNEFSVHNFKYVPYGIPQSIGEAFTHTFTLNHLLSNSTFYELRVSRYNSESKQYVYKDPTQSISYLVSVQEDTANGIVGEVFDPTTPEGQSKLQSLITLGASWDYIADPNGPDGYIDPDLITPPAANSFMNRGMDITHTERNTKYWVAKFDLTSQINKTNQIKLGSEVRLHELDLQSFQIIPATDESGQEITPFKPAVPDVSSIFRYDYTRKPREISAYLQDKLEFNKIILNLGLRWDYFDANSVIPTDPTDPSIYTPFKDINIYKDLNGDGTISDNEKVPSNEYTPDERKAFMHKKVDAKTFLSPRLGIAFPITDRGVIHFSYGHFFQIPEFQYLYANPDFKITSSQTSAIFGNPDLEPQKTVMYEIGLQQQLSDDIGVDLTLFYRDVRDWVGTSPEIKTAFPSGTVEYSMYENKDYENVKGVTLKLEKRFSYNYSFRVDYTYQTAEGTYSNPTDEYNRSLAGRAAVLLLTPTNWDQRHTLNAQIIYDIDNWTFSLIGRFWSGRPYTPSFPVAETVGSAAQTVLTNNSARRPAQKIIDLTINKSFKLFSNFDIELFINVYNLLDERDETSVYGDTGTADYTTTINPSKIQYSPDRVSTVEDFVLQPSWYTAPRQVQLGLILGF